MSRKINNPKPPKKSQLDQLGIMTLIGWKIADIEVTPIPANPSVNLTLAFIPEKTQKRRGRLRKNEPTPYKAFCCTLTVIGEWSIEDKDNNIYQVSPVKDYITNDRECRRYLQQLMGLTVKDIHIDQEKFPVFNIYFKKNFRMKVTVSRIQENQLSAPLILDIFFNAQKKEKRGGFPPHDYAFLLSFINVHRVSTRPKDINSYSITHICLTQIKQLAKSIYP